MSEMVERVRKAICDERGGECSCIGDVEIARAAIAAMREPTEAILDAATNKAVDLVAEIAQRGNNSATTREQMIELAVRRLGPRSVNPCWSGWVDIKGSYCIIYTPELHDRVADEFHRIAEFSCACDLVCS